MRKCQVEGCNKKYCANGYCAMHNTRFKKYGDINKINGRWDGYIKQQKKCSNNTCNNLVWKGKYCGKCAMRKRRYGDINIVNPHHRKYFFNEKLMDNWTNESAWILGWILTDGNIDKELLGVHLNITDYEIIEIIRLLFQHEKLPYIIKPKNQSRKLQYKINLQSKYLVNRFLELNIPPAKSLIVKLPPDIPDNVFWHFLRGCIEGDGCIGLKDKDYLYIKIDSASKDFITELNKKIMISHSCYSHIKPNGTIMYRIVFSGSNAEKLAELIYKDSEGLRLTRKYNKYQEYLELKKQKESAKYLDKITNEIRVKETKNNLVEV